MKKRILLTVFLSLLLCMSVAAPVLAENGAAGGSDQAKLVDQAGLLNDEEAEALASKLEEISQRQKCDVAIVTVDTLGGKSATEFSDDYFDTKGYGAGKERDGVMLVLSMKERDWAITTRGFGITAFTDAGQTYIMDQTLPMLSDGAYGEGFDLFADSCDDFITQAKNGEPYDVEGELKSIPLIWVPVCFTAGAVIAAFLKKKKRASLKNVRFKIGAADYTKPGSLSITGRTDILVSKVVSQSEKQKERDHNSGGGSTHISSSGATHGGFSGKF